jgi:dipeptidyl aminopeptidase/acylaminoacyl peptidase
MKSTFRVCGIFSALLAALWLLPGCVAQALPEKFTVEQVTSAPFPQNLTAARSGSRIAWAFIAQGRRNVWAAEGPKFAARQLTPYNSDDGQEIADVQFAGDGNFIVYVRGGNRNQAGEIPNPISDPAGVDQAVWAVAFSGGTPRKIDVGRSPVASPKGNWVVYTKENQLWIAPVTGPGAPQQIVARGQNTGPVWSPDGSKVAFVSGRGTHSWIGIYDPAKKSVGFVAPTVDRDNLPRWSPDGKSIAFVRIAARPITGGVPGGGFGFGGGLGAGPWSIWTAEIGAPADNVYAEGKAKQAWNSATFQGTLAGAIGGGPVVFTWAADGRIVFSSEKDGWQHLYSLPLAGGEPALLTPGECEVETQTFTPDLKAVVYAANCGDIDRRHLWRVSVTGGAPVALTTGESIEWAPVVTADGRWIAYLGSDARQPAMPHVREFDATGKGTRIAEQALPKDFPSDKLVVPQQVIITAADGMKIHCQLFLPANLPTGTRAPAAIFMHGGPPRQMMLGFHNRYYYHNAYALNQYLASRGYVVLSVNYRLGIGYGRAFRMAEGGGARGASEYQDIVAGGKYLAARPDVDPAKVGLWGGSYGGYLTAMGLARNSDLFAAGVDLHGVHDWAMRQFAGGGPGGAAAPAAQSPQAAERARVAREASPVSSINKWKSPVLVIQGDDDRNVNFDQMVDLIPRLREQKVHVEQIVFPDEVHDFLLYRRWVQVYRAAFDFFERYLRTATPRGND